MQPETLGELCEVPSVFFRHVQRVRDRGHKGVGPSGKPATVNFNVYEACTYAHVSEESTRTFALTHTFFFSCFSDVFDARRLGFIEGMC